MFHTQLRGIILDLRKNYILDNSFKYPEALYLSKEDILSMLPAEENPETYFLRTATRIYGMDCYYGKRTHVN